MAISVKPTELIPTIIDKINKDGYSSLETFTINEKGFTMEHLSLHQWTGKTQKDGIDVIITRKYIGFTMPYDFDRSMWCYPISEGTMYQILYNL